MKRVEHAEPGLCETLIESLEVRLYHNEIKRIFKLESVECLVEHAYLWSQVISNVFQKSNKPLFKHVGQV